jgi:hypothetical protein
MIDGDVLTRINEKLELITFVEVEDNTFRLVGNYAPWVLKFCPELADNQQLSLKNHFAFLENFIEQSREYFQSTDAQSLGSGPWSERDSEGLEKKPFSNSSSV